jgi:putative FmdB family regulatory protein
MPIYEYKCQKCEQCIELLQKISDPPETDCPHCGKATLLKQVSNTSFRLTGDGWYVTDFKSNGQKKSTKDSGSNTASSPE